ncbi:MAG: hypothetical protein V2B19_00880 [Pseudomonadota bacterium]
MGRERSGTMVRFFLYLAGGMILMTCLLGCAYFPNKKLITAEPPDLIMAREEVAAANMAIANGDFPLALRKNEEISARSPGILGDQVLYQRGLIHAHPRNPEQNVAKAIEAYRELKEKFPGSNLELETEAWILTLETISQKEEALRSLKKDLQKREKTIARLNTQTGPRRALIKQLNNQVSQLENQVLLLESQLEMLKKVDLGIEEKKRTGTEH